MVCPEDHLASSSIDYLEEEVDRSEKKKHIRQIFETLYEESKLNDF